MSPRIARLKTELKRLEGTTETCHPEVQTELQTLIEDMKTHLTELEDSDETREAD